MKPAPKAATINAAAAMNPKTGQGSPAKASGGASGAAGSMGSANMAGAFSGASAELKAQHPIAHYDHGPHHGTAHHIRHKPMKMS